MSELPKGWAIAELDDLITRMSNGANVGQYDERVGLPISRIETIWNGKIDSSRVKYITECDDDFVAKYRLEKDDILFSHINSDNHLGKTAIYKGYPIDLIHGINLLLIRFHPEFCSDFFNYQFQFLKYKGAFIEVAQRAVNQSSINQKKLKTFSFVIPPANEQKRIVAKIEELFSELDSGIESLKTAREQLKVYRQAVLKHAFADITSGDQESYKRLEDVISETLIGMVRSGEKQNEGRIGYKYIKMNNIDMIGNIDFQNVVYVAATNYEVEKYSLKSGDVLFNTRNSYELVGKTGIVKNPEQGVLFNNNIMRMRFTHNINPSFMCYQLISPCIRDKLKQKKKATTSVCAIYQKDLMPIEFWVPAIAIQERVVRYLDDHFEKTHRLEISIENELQKSEALRQSILKKAFSGQLVAQNPADEPASHLLERIRSEKQKGKEKQPSKPKKRAA